MGRLVMAHLEVDPEDIDIRVSDIQRIQRLPEAVKQLIEDNFKGKRILKKSGLPSVLYLGPDRVQVIGAFNYGDVAFMEIEGKWSNIVKADTLVCITPYREDATYEELEEGKQEYIDGLKEKYPNGLTVGE